MENLSYGKLVELLANGTEHNVGGLKPTRAIIGSQSTDKKLDFCDLR